MLLRPSCTPCWSDGLYICNASRQCEEHEHLRAVPSADVEPIFLVQIGYRLLEFGAGFDLHSCRTACLQEAICYMFIYDSEGGVCQGATQRDVTAAGMEKPEEWEFDLGVTTGVCRRVKLEKKKKPRRSPMQRMGPNGTVAYTEL